RTAWIATNQMDAVLGSRRRCTAVFEMEMLLLLINRPPLIDYEAARFFAQLIAVKFARWRMGCPSGRLPHPSAWRERGRARLYFCSNLRNPLAIDGKMGLSAQTEFSARRTSIRGEEEALFLMAATGEELPLSDGKKMSLPSSIWKKTKPDLGMETAEFNGCRIAEINCMMDADG
ncbi:hypothetical protein ACLOJK_039181, partial [Asimina triloba]